MATTTNYGWTTPDNSGLVKNGAQDIRTLGSSVDTAVWNVGYGNAGKNKIINGAFDFWQRGTSASASGYLADRWNLTFSVAPTTYTQSRQSFTAGTAPVSGYEGQYFWRYAITTVGSNTDMYFGQSIEDVRTFAGQTMTFSLWLKADSARTITLSYNQNFGSGGSGSVSASMGTFNVTSSWQRFSAAVTIPSVTGKTIGTSSYLQFFMTATPANGFTIDCWGVQAENGSTATPFSRNASSIQGELAACQRYYVRWGGSALYEAIGLGTGATTTIASIYVNLPVQMRVSPTSIDYSTLGIFDGTAITGSAIPTIVSSYTGNKVAGLDATVASGVTVNRPYRLITNNSTSGYLGLSAEL